MHNFREIALGLIAFFLMVIFASSEQLAESQKFKEVSGVVALAGYWESASVKGFTLVDQVGLPPRMSIDPSKSEGYWHILLTDVEGLSREQAKFISVALGRRALIHPIFVDYVQHKIQSKDPSRPEVYLCLKASIQEPLKIGAKLTLQAVTLVDTGGMRWSMQVDHLEIDPGTGKPPSSE